MVGTPQVDTTEIRAVRVVLILSVLFSIPPLFVFPMTGRPLAAYIVVGVFVGLNLLGLWMLRLARPPLRLICLVVGLGMQGSLFTVYYFGLLEAHAYPFVLAGVAPVLTAMVVEDRRVAFLLWIGFAVGAFVIYQRPLGVEDSALSMIDRGDLAHHYSQAFGLLAIAAAFLLRRVRRYQRELSEANQELEKRVAERTDRLETSNRQLQLALDERTQAMEAFAASQEQLVAAQKTESVARLAGGIAHDFNNLLTVVLSATYLAREELDEDDSIQAELQAISDAANKASELTGQLLAYSRQDVMELKPVSLNQVCLNSAKLMRRVMGEHITICTDLQAEFDTVFVDRSRLDQVLLNLTVNARDAMPEGGELKIHTQSSEKWVELHIIDQGHGISDELLPKIFDPFLSTKPPGVGTGLGLSTVAGIVEQFGGSIDVASVEGIGSTFVVKLPLVRAELLRERIEPTGSFTGSSQTVLVVEDNLTVLATVQQTLESIGFHVLTADRPSKGLLLVDHDGPIDCLVSDLVMPEQDGLNFVREFLGRRKVPVVMMTGHVPDATIRGSLVGENVTLLRKPFRPDELVERIIEAMAEGTVQV